MTKRKISVLILSFIALFCAVACFSVFGLSKTSDTLATNDYSNAVTLGIAQTADEADSDTHTFFASDIGFNNPANSCFASGKLEFDMNLDSTSQQFSLTQKNRVRLATFDASTEGVTRTANGDGWFHYSVDFSVVIPTATFNCLRNYGGATPFQVANVKIVNSIEQDFTNNGQFAVSVGSFGTGISYVDTTGLPSGCSGAVLKLANGGGTGTEGALFDFSSAHILASDVESITVRIYSPDYSATDDEFRTYNGTAWVQYGFGAYDMSNWVDITLNAASMNEIAKTGVNGELGSTWIGIRSRNGTHDYYIDSVIINLKPTKTPNVTVTQVGPWGWNNAGHSFNGSTPAGTRWTILNCSSNPAASDINVATTENSASLGVKLNNKSFYEWYQEDNRFALNSKLGYFMWQIPEEYTEGGIITVEEGTEYDSLVLPASTFYFNGTLDNGGWDSVQYVDTGKQAYFSSIYSANPDFNTATSLLLVFNTSDGGNFDNTAANTAKFSVSINDNANSNRTVNYWSGTKWMSISIGAGVVSEGSKLTVYDGTIFGGYTIKGTYTFTFTSGTWALDPVYDDVVFTGFFEPQSVYNNKHIGGETYWSVFITLNVSDFAIPDRQIRPDVSGVYLNGNPVPNNLLTLWNANRFWIRYTDADKVANVNGYSHPTIEFKNAVIKNDQGKTYTVQNFKLYFNLDTELWQTTKPVGYTVEAKTDYSSIATTSQNEFVISFSDEETWTNDLGNLKGNILLDGKKTLTEDGGSVVIDSANKKITITTVNSYKKVNIAVSNAFGNIKTPEMKFVYIDGAWKVTDLGYFNGFKTTRFGLNQNMVDQNGLKVSTINLGLGDVFDQNAYIGSASGIYMNGVPLTTGNKNYIGDARVLLIGIGDGIWLQFTPGLSTADYSHLTFHVDTGASITNSTINKNTYYLDEFTLYLDNGQWTTEKPNGYLVVKPTTFDSIDPSSTATSLVLKYTDDADWINDLGTLSSNVLLDGNPFNGTISVNTVNKTITFNLLSSVSKLSINTESICAGVKISKQNFYFHSGTWNLHNLPNLTLTANGIGPWGWNNAGHDKNDGTPVGATWTIIPFSNGTFTASSDNLVTTDSEVASMIKLNGKTFGELYKTNNLYAFNTALGYAMFQVPVADLVSGNGYDYPTIEIEAGLPLQGQYLPKVTVILVNGVWIEKPNYEPTMTAFTENDAGGLFVLVVDFDTKSFGVPADLTKRNVLASNGFTLNGEEIIDVRTLANYRIWFVENKAKRVADYNGYSHPTFEIAEGATLTDADNNVFTFHAVTLYYVDGVWTTVKPNGYLAIKPTTFDSIVSSSTETSLVLKYTDDADWINDLGDLSSNVLLDGNAFNGTISVDTTNKTITFSLLSGVSKLSINANSVCAGVKISKQNFYCNSGTWDLRHTPTVTMTADGVGPWTWNNADSSVNGTIPVGTIWTLIPFSCGAFSYDATNLIVTDSEVASMIKFNGVTFGELYANNNLYAFTTQLGHPMFQIPKTDLVAGNGYEYPTVEIEAGLPVEGQYLPAVTAILVDGKWMEKPNYEPTMTAFSENDADKLFVLIVDFDTKAFGVPEDRTSRNVLASKGFTFNYEEIADIRTIENYRLWFVGEKAKRVADYNGYSHPTFEIAEGATLTDADNNVFTFHATTLYYVDGVWTTVKPDNYLDSGAVRKEFTHNDQFKFSTVGGTVKLLSAEDMALEGISGYTNSVLKLSNSASTTVKIDYTDSKIPLTLVENIKVRVYAVGTANGKKPEFRMQATNYATRGLREWIYLSSDTAFAGDGGYSLVSILGTWYEFDINGDTLKDGLRDLESETYPGYLGAFNIMYRCATDSEILYIDFIDISVKADDGIGPVITYTKGDTLNVPVNSKLDFGATAFDFLDNMATPVEAIWSPAQAFDSDGKLLNAGTFTVKLVSVDSHKNETSITVTVIVGDEDTVAPVINVPFDSISLKTGTRFKFDAVRYASDAYLDTVTCENSLGMIDARNCLLEGTHTMTITATDTSGNKTVKVITVYVTNGYSDTGVVVTEENFVMVDGASVRLASGKIDGTETTITNGIRFQVAMDEAVKNAIDGTTVKLYMFVAPVDVVDVATAPYSVIESYKAKWQLLDKDKIFEQDGSFIASAVMCNLSKSFVDRQFNAIAIIEVVGGTPTYYYATAGNTTRSMYQVVNSAVLDDTADYTGSLLLNSALDYATWYGTNDLPVIISTIAQYNKLVEDINNNKIVSSTITILNKNNLAPTVSKTNASVEIIEK